MDKHDQIVLKKNTTTSIRNFFENDICDNMKLFILGGTNVKRLCQPPSYMSCINNIFTLAFIFAYGCLKCDINSDEPISENVSSQSSLRIINSLKKAYSQYPVTPELVQFVLTDIQFEMLQDEDSELYEIFKRLSPFSSREFSLMKYFKLIAEWKVSPFRFLDGVQGKSLEVSIAFLELLENLSFLKNYNLVRNDDGGFDFVSKDPRENENYLIISVNHLIHYYTDVDEPKMYSLFGIEKSEYETGQKLELKYICERLTETISFTVAENATGEGMIDRMPEEVFSEISLLPWDDESDSGEKKTTSLINQVHTINYKYIKNLALAISDTIDSNVGSKTALYEAFSRHDDGEIFAGLNKSESIETQKFDWDSVIVMLLIEHSPTSVLEVLFMNEQNFVDIARNLCKRIDNPKMYIRGLNKTKLMQQIDRIIKEKLIYGEASVFGKIPNANNKRLRARAMAMLIISSLSAVHEEETVEKSICAGNIYDNMTLLEKMKTTMTPEQRCKYVSIILGETFRHIICFYKGLIKYGEIKSEFDAKSNLSCLSESDIARDQKALHDAFLSKAKEEADSLKDFNASNFDDMLALMHRFIELCEECGSGSSSEKYRRALYSAIGKYELLNTSEFKKYALGHIASFKSIDENNVNEWIAFAFHILEYLRNGTFKLSGDNPSRAIYPYTATCNSGNENYEGFKTVTLTLNYDFDGDAVPEKMEIKVLSEFSYDLSNVFYCLPNVLRTSNSWWIDPVLINFKDFNDIFVD